MAVVAFLGVLLSFGRRELAELFAVAEDEIHVTIEGHELAYELPSVLDLRALRHRHCPPPPESRDEPKP